MHFLHIDFYIPSVKTNLLSATLFFLIAIAYLASPIASAISRHLTSPVLVDVSGESYYLLFYYLKDFKSR